MSLSRQSPRFGPVRFPPQGSGPTDGPHFHVMSRVGLVGSAAPFAEPQRRSLAVTQRQPDAPRRVVSFTGDPMAQPRRMCSDLLFQRVGTLRSSRPLHRIFSQLHLGESMALPSVCYPSANHCVCLHGWQGPHWTQMNYSAKALK